MPINRARADDVPIRSVRVLANREPPIGDHVALFFSKKSADLAESRFLRLAEAFRHVPSLFANLGQWLNK